ncbi:MAG: hypothetical protein WD030_06515 [Pirellulales bacterium]
MAASNRSALLTKTHKVLKKEFKPYAYDQKRPLLEQMLYAGCLEGAMPEAADEAFAAFSRDFFDWNEVRVSTVTELAEAAKMLPDPAAAASRVKRVLQSVFESIYEFDLESLKKQNIGAATKKLEKIDGATPFTVAFVTQNGLGGHAIPVNKGALDALYVIGVIDEKEHAAANVPGLERAIPKNKGMEFGSLLHQLGVEYARSPYSPSTRKILIAIEPTAKDRLPKRASTKKAPEPKTKKKKQAPAKTTRTKKAAAKKTTAKKAVKKKTDRPAKTKRIVKKKPR